MKNRYHPLLKQKYFPGVLSSEEIAIVNPRTLYSWAHINQHDLAGYNPNDPLIKDKEVFAFLHNQDHVRKMMEVYMTLFNSFHSILTSIPGFVQKLKENKKDVIKAYRRCLNFIKSAEFETITGISSRKINRWENEIHCENSFLKICKKQSPRQLTLQEQLIITDELQDPENDHLFICDIWAKLLRANKLKCKLETFYKYARIAIKKLGLRKRKVRKVVHSIIANSPFAVLHMDCTLIRTQDGGRWFLNIIYDNFSKAILGIKAMLSPNSFDVALNLKNVIDEYRLHHRKIFLYCDGGPENKQHVNNLLLNYPKIKKFTTSLTNCIHNNMIESYNSKFKRRHIRLLDLSLHEKVPEQIENFKRIINNTPQALTGTLSPNEIISGLHPWKSIWPKLQNAIEIAKKERIEINLNTCCAFFQSKI